MSGPWAVFGDLSSDYIYVADINVGMFSVRLSDNAVTMLATNTQTLPGLYSNLLPHSRFIMYVQ